MKQDSDTKVNAGAMGQKAPNLGILHPSHLANEILYASRKDNFRLSGTHQLPLKQPDRDPIFSRFYQAGDPIKHIDWKAYARTDNLIIREKRNESSARVSIMLETSRGMNWPDSSVQEGKRQYPTKLEIATRIALNLAHFYLKLGDQINLLIVDSEQGFASKQVTELLQASDIISAYDFVADLKFDPGALKLLRTAELASPPPSDICFWVGDTLNGIPDKRFLANSRTTSLIQVLSSLETDLHWVKDTSCYFDHTQTKKEFLGRTLKHGDNYKNKLAAWCKTRSTLIENMGGHYTLLTDESPISSYFNFLQQLVVE